MCRTERQTDNVTKNETFLLVNVFDNRPKCTTAADHFDLV